MTSRRQRSLPAVALPFLSVVLMLAASLAVAADRPEQEFNLVFILQGIQEQGTMALTTVAVTPVGEATYTSDLEIAASLGSLVPELPPIWAPRGDVGHVGLFGIDPADFGGTALVDRRDGAPLVVGTVVWAGLGHVVLPDGSSHAWQGGLGLTDGPTSWEMFPASWLPDWGDAAALNAAAFQILARTDVLHSVASLGEYTWISAVYLPAVGTVDTEYAQLVVVVTGQVGPPWNGAPVGAEARSWSEIRRLFD